MLQCRTNGRPAWPNGGTLAHRRPLSECYLRIEAPMELLCFLIDLSFFNLSCHGPQSLCANGRTAPQPSLRISDSGNGPAATGE